MLRYLLWTLHLTVLQGWSNADGDKHFQKLREIADSSNNDKAQQETFWKINLRIGSELKSAGAFVVPDSSEQRPKCLHLCIAPGGYTEHLLQTYPEASVKGITLPLHLGGHPMVAAYGEKDPRVQVDFMDLTMLAVEYGTPMSEIPQGHPDAKNFSSNRPFLGETFGHVLCDGQILRTHFREEYRQTKEIVRLNVAQLIFGMTRISPRGTFVMLLHKADAFDNIELLKTFDDFSKVKLCKPQTIHAVRSSFYMIATDVDPTHPKAKEAVEQWKKDWKRATFDTDENTGMNREMPTEDKVKAVLKEFGPRLIELARDIWQTQKNALGRASYTKTNSRQTPSSAGPRSPYTKTVYPEKHKKPIPRSPYGNPAIENTAPLSWRKASISKAEPPSSSYLDSAKVASPWAKSNSPTTSSSKTNSEEAEYSVTNSSQAKMDPSKVRDENTNPIKGSTWDRLAFAQINSGKAEIESAKKKAESSNAQSDEW